MQVLPIINCLDEECVKHKIKTIEGFLKKDDWVHIDVADAVFTFHKTWGGPTEWANMRPKFNFEAHLMVERPDRVVADWVTAGAKRLIVHAETIIGERVARRILEIGREKGVEIMLASTPFTTTAELWPYLKLFSHFQVLAVEPGPANQKFMPQVLPKIKFLRNIAPNAIIEVDGGVNPDVAREVKMAGANAVASSHYILSSQNPKKAYKELQKI